MIYTDIISTRYWNFPHPLKVMAGADKVIFVVWVVEQLLCVELWRCVLQVQPETFAVEFRWWGRLHRPFICVAEYLHIQKSPPDAGKTYIESKIRLPLWSVFFLLERQKSIRRALFWCAGRFFLFCSQAYKKASYLELNTLAVTILLVTSIV